MNDSLMLMALERGASHISKELQNVPDRQPHRMTLELDGYPGGHIASITAARIDTRMFKVIVREIDGKEAPWGIFEVEADREPALNVEDGSIEGRNGTRWYPASPERFQREVVEVDAKGEEVWHWVDTTVNPYVLECECGRKRFARKTATQQVDRCRVCARPRRLAYQTAWQRRNRKKSKSSSL